MAFLPERDGQPDVIYAYPDREMAGGEYVANSADSIVYTGLRPNPANASEQIMSIHMGLTCAQPAEQLGERQRRQVFVEAEIVLDGDHRVVGMTAQKGMDTQRLGFRRGTQVLVDETPQRMLFAGHGIDTRFHSVIGTARVRVPAAAPAGR